MPTKDAIEQFRRMFQYAENANDKKIENHFTALGFKVIDVQQGKAQMDLPYADNLVGNPVDGTLAAGPLMALLDSCCALASATSGDTVSFCPTLDLRVDHLGLAKPNLTIHAEAEVYRHSRFVIFTRAIAYQDNKDQAIARCTVNFTPINQPVVSENLNDKLLKNRQEQDRGKDSEQ